MKLYMKSSLILFLLGLSTVGICQKPIGYISCGHHHHETQFTQKKANDFDVVKYHINLDFTDFSNKSVSGFTQIDYVASADINTLEFQFEGLTVDSVISKSQRLTYSRNEINLTINLIGTLLKNQTDTVAVYYHGKPKRDGSWGGFYYSGDYAFNLGVAFTSSPHNYGRIWFPCVDNFTDRAQYDFAITCTSDKKAFCNGELTSEVSNGDGTTTFNWMLAQPIPTYLASVAIAPYTVNQYTHNGIPVTLTALAEDSLNMVESFRNLNGCIDAYIARYGPHTFSRIGFNAVPFSGGAMEHATNIAYPIFAIDSFRTYETLYAHELGHHWWGNTVTCRTAEDMWINEGWASYSERIFLEWIYGKERYDEDISSNHRAVLHYAHLRDGDTLAISGIGHTQTYGSHVYDKGADVAHTLRGYMGDSSFFEGIQSFLETYKFKDVSSQDLEKHLQNFTPIDLKSFFNNWVYNRGFPHFSVLGYSSKPDASKFLTRVDIGQRLRFAPDYFEKVPMDVTFYANDFSTQTYRIELGKERQQLVLSTDFVPTFVALDINKKISDAITDDMVMVKDTGLVDFGDAMMTMHVKQSSDSSLVRVEHNWVGADAFFTDGKLPFVSRERYWNVDGVWNKDFKADATIEYFGRVTGTNYLIGYLDVDLIRKTEENMVLMYRANPSAQWVLCTDYSWEMGSKFDKRGSFTIHNVRKGQYAFGVNEADRLSVPTEMTESNKFVTVYPNPTRDTMKIAVEDVPEGIVEITDGAGRIVYTDQIENSNYTKTINVSEWVKGIYYVGIVIDGKPYQPKRVLVR
ncbi:MAG: hypothetical protein ACI9JN_000585 [Bacteroidia bacterium]|jgi:hypothetical protein